MMEQVLSWLPAIILIVQALMGWGMWSLGRKFLPRDECEDCRKGTAMELKATAADLGELRAFHLVSQAEQTALPTKWDIEKIYTRINAVDSGLSALRGEVTATRRSLDLIHAHLLEK